MVERYLLSVLVALQAADSPWLFLHTYEPTALLH